MAKFRCHRGSLKDSLETQVEVGSLVELVNVLRKDPAFANVSVEDIDISFYAHDYRLRDYGLRTDVYIVDVKGKGVAGFIDVKELV